MGRGGARPGCGRKKGTPNSRTRKIANKLEASGALMPLEVICKAMTNHAEAGEWDAAAVFAEKAAPYMHPRLQAIQHTGQNGGPIETKDVTPIERAKAFALFMSMMKGE